MQKLYNFFLFRYLHKDFVELSQTRLTLNFCLVTALFSLLYTVTAILINFQASAIVMPIIAVLFLGLAFLMRTPISPYTISFLYLLLSYIASIILIYFSGMIYSSITPWLSFIPLSANLLINRKVAIGWFIVCFISVIMFAIAQENYSNVAVNYDKAYEVWFYAIVYNGLTGIILVLSMIFQNAKDAILTTLKEKNELISSINLEFKSKNEEVVTQYESLIQQKEEIAAQGEFIEIKNRELLLIQDELNDLIEKLTLTQSELSNREAENRSILDAIYNTQLIVGEFDINGKLSKISSNALKFLEANNDEIIGKSLVEIGQKVKLNVDNNSGLDKMWKDLLNGKQYSQEATLEIHGKKQWLKQNFFPVLNDKGKAEKIMVISLNISQLRNQQYEIEVLNSDLKETIWKFEKQNDLLISQQKEIEFINDELKNSNQEIQNINQSLETRVIERTKDLEYQNKQLAEYSYINAHLLRAPLCSILGLVQIMEIDCPEKDNILTLHMKKSTKELKDIVSKISKVLEKGPHFNRDL
ncbi:MAG: hypothetical protein KAI29_01865 [Cyclobacteriaceae bacterium]|nr:hypothetical protein [Cyclobacteriaceae bacterium]